MDNPTYEKRWLRDLSNKRLILDLPVGELTDEELDRHMNVSHDRDSGERGLNWNTNPPSYRRASMLRVHAQLHETGTWVAVPHRHGRTLPFLSWRHRLRRLRWRVRWHLIGRRERPKNMAAQSESKSDSSRD